MPHADVNGQRLHYLRDGSGEPLLLIQGLSGNHLHWGEPFLSLITPQLEAIAYDHRGIGRSGPALAGYSIADLADDAIGLLDELELESVHVMGISMGGMVGQELALRAPHRIRTLTLGCTYAGGPGSQTTDPAIVQHLTGLFMAGRVGEAMREGFRYNVSPQFGSDPDNLDTFKRIAGELPASLEVLMAQLQAVGGHDTSQRLNEISVPTLVVHGSLDRILPVANAHAIAERVPGARLEILDDVGHLFWWERPQRAAELLLGHAQGAPAAQ